MKRKHYFNLQKLTRKKRHFAPVVDTLSILFVIGVIEVFCVLLLNMIGALLTNLLRLQMDMRR